jgi:hypothetical protein
MGGLVEEREKDSADRRGVLLSLSLTQSTTRTIRKTFSLPRQQQPRQTQTQAQSLLLSVAAEIADHNVPLRLLSPLSRA